MNRLPRVGFLHVCGGVSGVNFEIAEACLFSPRMWRCFWSMIQAGQEREVFSTYVEVFPLRVKQDGVSEGFLHVCGGVSA